MTKKRLFAAFLAAAVAVSAFAFSGCNFGGCNFTSCNFDDNSDNAEEHNCVYNQQIVEDDYLKTAATHASKAIYYYSCECGKHGEETFEYGEAIPHTYDKQVATAEYLKSEATHTARAVYYYSCECGKKGTETFEYGEQLQEHTYDKQVVTAEYLKSEATHTAKAVYYYSCECGEKSTVTFEYGETISHTYDKQVATAEYLKSEKTSTEKAKYYLSCECGEYGEETFDYGYYLPSEGIEYTLNDEQTEYYVSEVDKSLRLNAAHIVIADKIDGKPVTSLDYNSFRNSSMRSIIIPSSVTYIGEIAFMYCSNLNTIIFDGTKAQWLAVGRGYHWNNYSGNYIVQCIDGKLDKNDREID